MLPDKVDFPASTCPIKTKLTTSGLKISSIIPYFLRAVWLEEVLLKLLRWTMSYRYSGLLDVGTRMFASTVLDDDSTLLSEGY